MSGQADKRNKARHKGSVLRNLAPLICLLFIAIFLLYPEKCLTAENEGSLLFAIPIRKGEIFEVRFTHSLNLSPVTDVIEWDGNEMILRKSVFKAFGAGIPIPSDGIGMELIHTDGHYELIGIDKPLQSFTIMTQTIPDHHVIYRGREIALLGIVGSGKTVDITVKRVPRIMTIENNL